MQGSVTLTIKPDGTVAVAYESGGIVARRETTLAAVAELFYRAVQDSAREEKWFSSPVLPPGTVAYRESQRGDRVRLALEWGPEVLPFTFYDTVYQAVPYPRLVFDFGLRRHHDGFTVSAVYLAAVADVGPLRPGTRLYRYPYSHVAEDTRMCLGTAPLPPVRKLADLAVLPRLILTTPNEDHHYGNWVNLSGKPLRELLREVDGLEAFPAGWLVPLGATLEEWLNRNCF
ncbi:hypothetical protein V3F56_03435 [Moorellaceae bacterium AZ2]